MTSRRIFQSLTSRFMMVLEAQQQLRIHSWGELATQRPASGSGFGQNKRGSRKISSRRPERRILTTVAQRPKVVYSEMFFFFHPFSHRQVQVRVIFVLKYSCKIIFCTFGGFEKVKSSLKIQTIMNYSGKVRACLSDCRMPCFSFASYIASTFRTLVRYFLLRSVAPFCV